MEAWGSEQQLLESQQFWAEVGVKEGGEWVVEGETENRRLCALGEGEGRNKRWGTWQAQGSTQDSHLAVPSCLAPS